MKQTIAALGFAFGLVLAAGGCAPGPDVTVGNPRFQAPLGGGEVGVAYFTIRSARPDRIVNVSSPAAKAVEMHTMVMNGDMMSMSRTPTVDLPAGKVVEFKPSGLHLMVFSPSLATAGGAIPITFELQSGLKKTVNFPQAKE